MMRLPGSERRRPQIVPHLIHTLERETSRFGNEKVDEKNADRTATAKDKAVLGTNLVCDGRRKVSDQEVPDPI